jgi:hypothetical protein
MKKPKGIAEEIEDEEKLEPKPNSKSKGKIKLKSGRITEKPEKSRDEDELDNSDDK